MICCPSCGQPVRDGAAFCPSCGSAMPAPAAPEYVPAPGYGAAGYAPQPAPEAKPVGRMKKLLLILIPAAVVIAAGAALLLTLGKRLFAGGEAKDPFLLRSAVSAFIDEDGNAFIPCTDGSCVKLRDPDGIEKAYLTPDGKHAVVLTREGELYLTDRKQAKQETLKKDVDDISIRSDAGFYFTADDKYYRYTFGDGSTVKLLNDIYAGGSIVYSQNTMSALYVRDDKLYRLAAGAEEPEKAASSDNQIVPVYISDDGKTVIWSENPYSGEYTFMLLEGETKTKLGKMKGGEFFYCSVSKDHKLIVIQDVYGESVLIWKKGDEAVKVKLKSDYSSVYTQDGPLERASSSGLRELYLTDNTDGGKNVYRVTLDGEKDRLLSQVTSWTVSGGWILWTDADGVLRCGKLKDGEIAEERELDEDVTQLLPGLYGKYFYYSRGASDDEPELCGYRTGDKSPTRIDSGVDGYWLFTVKVSLSGDEIFYLKDMEMGDSGGEGSGTLMSWSWDGERKKIAEDVYCDYSRGISLCRSGMLVPWYFVDARGFWFMTDVEDGCGDLYFWNGKEKTKLASGVYPGRDYY